MSTAELPLIDDIRAASRQMVRELGFMEATLAATDYPPSAVHAILEIGIRGPMTARATRRVPASGEIERQPPGSQAGRERRTEGNARCGRRADQAAGADREGPSARWPRCTKFGRRQVSGALSRLTEAERRTVRDGLMLYARALKTDRAADAELQTAS